MFVYFVNDSSNYHNIFGKKNNMRFIILSFISVCILLSCSSEELNSYPVGSDFVENDIQVRVLDTFSINTGTFKLDSLVTSSTNRILLGSVSDANFGHLTAQSYFQVNNSAFYIHSDAVYDSIGFVLNYDAYYYGDTLQTQNYNIHRVLETVRPNEGDEFYNTSSLDFDSESLGELSFTPKPNSTADSLYIPMKHELGEEIFDKIVDDDINNSDEFLQYFKGLTIIPGTQIDSHIIGYNVVTSETVTGNSSMRLYYTVEDDDSEGNSYYIDFYISSSDKQFNQTTTDLSNTLLDNFEDSETIIPGSETEHLVFSQAITGISARIEIPHLKNLNEISNDGTTLSAELTFAPQIGSYSDQKPLKDSLAVYIVDHKNRILNQLLDIDSNSSYAILNEDDDEFNGSTYYHLNLDGYVEEILNTDYDLNYALMIQFIDYDKTVDSVVLENDPDNSSKAKLTVKYLNY